MAAQMEAEKKKAAGNSRDQLTVDMARLDAVSIDLSNDRLMRLGEERLARRIRITEMSTQKFWKVLHTQEDRKAWSLYHVDCLQIFPSLEPGCLEKAQQRSNQDKG